jgi:hypothetical protein
VPFTIVFIVPASLTLSIENSTFLACCLHKIKLLYSKHSRLRYRTTMMTVRRFKNGVSLMSLIFKNDALSLGWVTSWHSLKNYWHVSKWSPISFSHCQWPLDGDFSFPRFVGLVILSLWLYCCDHGMSIPIYGCDDVLVFWTNHPCDKVKNKTIFTQTNRLLQVPRKHLYLFI